jgi:hypothetical protein
VCWEAALIDVYRLIFALVLLLPHLKQAFMLVPILAHTPSFLLTFLPLSLPHYFPPDIHLDLTQLPQKTLKGVVHITFACQSPTEGRKIVLDAVAFAELEVSGKEGREGSGGRRKEVAFIHSRSQDPAFK